MSEWRLGLAPQRVVAALVLAAGSAVLAFPGTLRPAVAFATVPAAPGAIRVSGNTLVGADGEALDWTGVSRSGTEYACAQDWGFSDGPTDDTSIGAMSAWGIDAVRVPLNEDCWLGINGSPATFSGGAYRAYIGAYVQRLLSHGMAVVLDLHFAAPGTALALSQAPMPDADHSAAFWTSVATAFRSTSGVAFELFNEPHDVSWSCWQEGGCDAPGYTDGSVSVAAYPAEGMQQLVNAIRSAGATQPILVDGLSWGNDLTGWLSHPLTDPSGQLAAAWHVYENSNCVTTSCWDAEIAPVSARVPVVTTEFGQSDCGDSLTTQLMAWADAHGIGYLAWAWDTWQGCGGPSLVSSYDGTPTAYGSVIKAHYLRAHAGFD